jgi:hypothetical protein
LKKARINKRQIGLGLALQNKQFKKITFGFRFLLFPFRNFLLSLGIEILIICKSIKKSPGNDKCLIDFQTNLIKRKAEAYSSS